MAGGQEAITDKAAPAGPALMGDRAARGFVWLLAQTMLLRAVTVIGQLVLAYLLTQEDFGVVALALTVHAFASILQQGGLTEILVKRQAHLHRWSNTAYWMSLALGASAGLLMAVGAPLAAIVYGNQRIIPLLIVLSISMVPAGLIVVPEAKLSAELRFRTLAVVGAVSVSAQMVLAVLFAALGMGAISMVLPRPIVLSVHALVVYLLARPRVRLRPQVRRWRYLISDNITLVLGKLCLLATLQGDYMVLGILTTERVAGVYYFAFGLSMQTMTLVTSNLGNVLFPVLSKLDDPVRQTQGFIRAARLLALVGVPLCLLQAGLADPVLRELFKGKWDDAIPILQILSLGMALRLVGSPAGSLFNAQGRFRTVLVLNSCYAVAFLSAVTAGALIAGGIGVAVGASIYFGLLGPVHMYIAISGNKGTWRDVWGVYAVPVLMSVAALAPAMWLADRLPPMPGRNWARMAVVTGTTGIIYLALASVLARPLLEELFARFGALPVVGRSAKRVAEILSRHGRQRLAPSSD
jgi:PST family polysaccharide transporter